MEVGRYWPFFTVIVKELRVLKSGPLRAVTPRSRGEAFELTATIVSQSFEGWRKALKGGDNLSTVLSRVEVTDVRAGNSRTNKRALELCPPVIVEAKASLRVAPTRRSALTTQEYIDVMLATVRESSSHVYWPEEVIARFLAADVITGTTPSE